MQEKLAVMNLKQCKFLANSAKYIEYILKNKHLKTLEQCMLCE